MPVLRENKTGSIESFYDVDSGRIREDGSGQPIDFVHPGAQREFVIGDSVSYLKITLPTGTSVVNEIRRPA